MYISMEREICHLLYRDFLLSKSWSTFHGADLCRDDYYSSFGFPDKKLKTYKGSYFTHFTCLANKHY